MPKFSLWWSNLFNLINLPEVSQVFPDAELLKYATFLQTWFHQNLCRSSWIQTMYGYSTFLTQSSLKAVLFVYYPLHLLQKCSFFRNCIKCCTVTQLHIPIERRYSPKNSTPRLMTIVIVILEPLFQNSVTIFENFRKITRHKPRTRLIGKEAIGYWPLQKIP